VTAKASSESHNTVLAQSPSPGARIAIGTTIRPTLSLGLAQVSVPDVKGLDEASARARLGDVGFDVAIDDQPTSDPSKDGVVVDQTPTSTSSAPKGSTVTITVARLG
jgi:beta-lactam-binding protein with PASTA domain